MAEVLRYPIRNFLGSKVSRLQEYLVIAPDCVEMVNADASTGAILPVKDDTVIDGSVQKTFVEYNGVWRSTNLDADYLQYNGRLYLTDGVKPKKTYSYIGVEYTEDLGIDKPSPQDASVSFYYGSIHNQPYIDAWFIEPFIIGLRGDETSTDGTHLDVYQFTDSGSSLLLSHNLAAPHGTKMFCHVIDGTTIAIFVLGSTKIEWYKLAVLGTPTITKQTDITPASGETFLSIAGPHDSANNGMWMNGSKSGSRWDSGWIRTSASLPQTERDINGCTYTVNFPFTVPTPPNGIETFFVTIKYSVSTSQESPDPIKANITTLQLASGGVAVGNNYAPTVAIPRRYVFSGVVNTGDWGVAGGITRERVEAGLSFNFGYYSVDLTDAFIHASCTITDCSIRVFGLIPDPTDREDKFEFYVGGTDGCHRFVYNSTSGPSILETWYSTKYVHGLYWSDSNLSVLYKNSDGSNPKASLINVMSVNADDVVLVESIDVEKGPSICHDINNEIYVGVNESLSDSSSAEVVCYSNDTLVEIGRQVLTDSTGANFPTGMCTDGIRVYVSDDYGSYSDIWTYLLSTMEPSGKIGGIYDSANYGKCQSLRRCGNYIITALASTDPNSFSGVWIQRINSEYLPNVLHYAPSKNNLDGVYSYGVTFYNVKDDTESEITMIVNDAYVVKGFFDVMNIPQPTDAQVTHIRLYRVGGALTVFSLIAELAIGVTSYRDQIADGEATTAISMTGRYRPPTDLRWITEAFGIFYGISGSKLYYTTQANPNYWTMFPIDLGDTGTGLAVTGQGLLAFTRDRTFFLSGTSPGTYTLYPLSRNQGCVHGKSIQEDIGGGVRWMSSDGLCFSNGGKPLVLSKEILGKITFVGIKASVWYDEVYYLAHSTGVFVADFRYSGAVRFRDLSDTDIDGMGVFDDTIYLHKTGGLHKAFASTQNRKVIYRTGVEVSTDPVAVKYYKNLRVWYKGRPTIKIYINGVQYGKSIVLDNKTDLTVYEIGIVDAPSGKYIQYRISGDFELHYLETVCDGNKKLS